MTAAVSACLHECQSPMGRSILYDLNKAPMSRRAEIIIKSVLVMKGGFFNKFDGGESDANKSPGGVGYFGSFKDVNVKGVDEDAN